MNKLEKLEQYILSHVSTSIKDLGVGHPDNMFKHKFIVVSQDNEDIDAFFTRIRNAFLLVEPVEPTVIEKIVHVRVDDKELR